MGDPATSLDIETLRSKFAEAESRIEALRRQQADSKAKAKAVIQKQRDLAAEKSRALEAENLRQAEELKAVKGLLRESDSEKVRLLEVKETLQNLVSQGKSDIEKLLVNQEEAGQFLQAALKARDVADANALKEKSELERRINGLQRDLQTERERVANGKLDDAAVIDNAANADALSQASLVRLQEELDNSRAEVLELQGTCEQLRKDNEALVTDVQSNRVGETQTGAVINQPIGEVYVEARQAKERSEELSHEVERMEKDMQAKDLEHERIVTELVAEKLVLDQKLSTSNEQVEKFRSSLEKSEMALQEEREKLLLASKNVSGVNAGDDGKKILEAKVAEMERLVASKQADIVKVRDKAKSYLKDINAEKREMEEKMIREAEALRKEVEAEQENVKLAAQRAESAASELDNCLALIREKQKMVQMLKMQMSSEKKAAMEAQRETEILRGEFNSYKERARKALQEKETSSSKWDSALEKASLMQTELDKSKKEILQLRRQLALSEESRTRIQELAERAEKAEAAADLLKNNAAGESAAKYNQIDVLEDKMAVLENDLMAARVAIEDAETRHDTTKMRLEATEKALHAAELRAEEAGRLSRKTIEGQRKQIGDLEKSLECARESSAAAQRTAAAAAKALAFTVPPVEEDATGASSIPRSSPQRNLRGSPHARHSQSGDISPYGDSSRDIPRSSFAIAMEGHSDSLGLAPRSSAGPTGNTENAAVEIIAKDQQITVLSSQLAELGALLDDAQQETEIRSQQTLLLKEEVKNLDAKLAAAEKLQNGAPFSYLRTIVVRYLETDDSTLLPVIANVLSFTDEESSRIKKGRISSSQASSVSAGSAKSSYFSIPFLG